MKPHKIFHHWVTNIDKLEPTRSGFIQSFTFSLCIFFIRGMQNTHFPDNGGGVEEFSKSLKSRSLGVIRKPFTMQFKSTNIFCDSPVGLESYHRGPNTGWTRGKGERKVWNTEKNVSIKRSPLSEWNDFTLPCFAQMSSTVLEKPSHWSLDPQYASRLQLLRRIKYTACSALELIMR